MSAFFSQAVSATLAWLTDHGVRLLLIIVGAICVHLFFAASIERVVRKAIRAGQFSTKEAEKKREDTIIRIASSALGVLLVLLATLMILSELGVAIAPLLAAAGVAGLAFGFGGQYLIRDLISGLFIIIENQYRIGDVVCFDGTCGLVENISMRMTTLRDMDGTVHHVPHGQINKVSNLSKDFSRVNINIGVSYTADLAHVERVVNAVGTDLATDPAWKDSITSAPKFLRVDDFADSAVVIKILGDTKPIQQWAVAGELRKRLKIAFDKEGIDIPFPQRTLHMVE